MRLLSQELLQAMLQQIHYLSTLTALDCGKQLYLAHKLPSPALLKMQLNYLLTLVESYDLMQRQHQQQRQQLALQAGYFREASRRDNRSW